MPTSTRDKVLFARARMSVLGALSLASALQPALAQDGRSVTVDIAECARIESPEARLACFGAQVDAALKDREVAGDAGTDNGEPAQATRAPDEPSTRAPRNDRSTRRPDRADESREAEYTGVIVEIRETSPNAYRITLDNGQVWQQVAPEPYPLRPGLEVRIYPTTWGSQYRLSGRGTGSHIRVREVR